MKIVCYAAALAAFLGLGSAKDERTFAVLRFVNMLTTGRMDPIVSPGETSQHVHGVLGGNGFKMGATKEDLMASTCTSASVQGDFSNYWFPTMYFQDPGTKKLEPVPYYYANVYYFFDPTDDPIKAFPQGLKMVGGDAMLRTTPEAAPEHNLDPSKGPVGNVIWTCPRNQNYNPPSWHPDSDGSNAGMGHPVNLEGGTGFPDQICDGTYSPLRADVHMPSCYNPEAGLDDYKNNMQFPTDAGNGKSNCPEGWIHVPHLFFEVYWDTQRFSGRWEPGTRNQPFVLANGDRTGYSSHADFYAGWDEAVLQNIIDTCNTGTDGMHKCAGVTENTTPCEIPSEVDEQIDGIMDKLPGDNPIVGWGVGGQPPAGAQGVKSIGKNESLPYYHVPQAPPPRSIINKSSKRSPWYRRGLF